MNREFKNMLLGIGAIIVLLFGTMIGLFFSAYNTGAGNGAYKLSLLFVIGQAAAITASYILWYLRVNESAVDMINTAEKRKMASHYRNHYLLRSFCLSGAIALVAVLCMVFNIIFVGISPLYCYNSVFTLFFTGNILLLVMMCTFGLPNRVTGSY